VCSILKPADHAGRKTSRIFWGSNNENTHTGARTFNDDLGLGLQLRRYRPSNHRTASNSYPGAGYGCAGTAYSYTSPAHGHTRADSCA
jgi:hypothetical protein